MHRLPLSLPGKSAPDAPLMRLCRALGTHPYAVALSALGWKPEPYAYHREEGNDLTWFVDSEVGRAHDLLTRWELPADSPKSLATTAPASPFLAAMCALENLVALQQWAATGRVPGFQRAGQFYRPGTSAEMQAWWGSGVAPIKGFAGFTHAAAVISCGFLPWPELSSHGNLPVVAFAAHSSTFPGLSVDDVERACQPASGVTLRQLPGFPPEEHPFYYALQSVLNLTGFHVAQEAARKHPRVVLKSRYSPASAIVSQEALREGRRDTEAFRDRLREHLVKSAS